MPCNGQSRQVLASGSPSPSTARDALDHRLVIFCDATMSRVDPSFIRARNPRSNPGPGGLGTGRDRLGELDGVEQESAFRSLRSSGALHSQWRAGRVATRGSPFRVGSVFSYRPKRDGGVGGSRISQPAACFRRQPAFRPRISPVRGFDASPQRTAAGGSA